MSKVTIIGAGLAGSEAALQLNRAGVEVDLYEMRPDLMTEAHTTGFCCEMVCSNSLGSAETASGAGLLKEELTILDSFVIEAARECAVPAGRSLSVDRIVLAEKIDKLLEETEGINLIRGEIKDIPQTDEVVIIATGPLTSPAFSEALTKITKRKNLFFYDATSPVIKYETIDMSKVYKASRYNKGEADFINIPLNKEAYDQFTQDLIESEKVEIRDFEDKAFFEACLPIEEIASRGPKSMAFGPLKPVGLEHPETGEMPYAVVQLRQDNIVESLYQMVGFQTRLKYGEQKRIFQTLPGLENAEFERYGRMHRNTYINAPLLIDNTYHCKERDNIFFAGQISGVEGYVESICSGLIAGLHAAALAKGIEMPELPTDSACGSLSGYISTADWKNFKPTKFTFGLLPETEKKIRNKKERKEYKANKAIESIKEWKKSLKI